MSRLRFLRGLRPQRGAALAFVLVVLFLFTALFLTSVQLISLEFRETVTQEQRDQAFHAAEAGVNYALWHLNDSGEMSNGLGIQERSLIRPVLDPQTQELVESELSRFFFEEVTLNGSDIFVVAVGEDAVRPEIIERVEARFVFDTLSGKYSMAHWRHIP